MSQPIKVVVVVVLVVVGVFFLVVVLSWFWAGHAPAHSIFQH